jgi:dienelactone hydrolase
MKKISRASIIKFLQPFPKKVARKVQVLAQIDYELYSQQKLSYYTEKEDQAFAYLLIPHEIKHTAVILCHHQHAGNHALGKSEVVGLAGDPDQFYAKELTEMGFVTFSPDALSFEERNKSKGDWLHNYYELASRLIKGENLLAKVLHDLSVAIDVVSAYEAFERFKIGMIGHSYGGKMAIWAPLFDERISVSVSNCGCLPYRHPARDKASFQMEFCVPDMANHFDIEDIVAALPPCSLLLSVTKEDKWCKGFEQIYEYAKPFFTESELALQVNEGGHIFTKEMRENAYAFLIKHLG